MFRQLAHSPDRPLLSPFGQASELYILDHPLWEWGQDDPSWTCGVMDGDVQEGSSLPCAVWPTLQDAYGRREGRKLREALRSTTACSRRPPAYASLRLPGAAERQRSALQLSVRRGKDNSLVLLW